MTMTRTERLILPSRVPSEVRINMQFELSVRTVRRPMLELRTVNLEHQGPGSAAVSNLFSGMWDFEAEDSMLFRESCHSVSPRLRTIPFQFVLTLQFIRFSDYFKGELGIFDHDPSQPNPVHTSTPDHLDLGTVIIRAEQHRTVRLRRDVSSCMSQYLAYVVAPHPVQRLIDGMFLLLFWNIVDTERALLLRG